MMKETIPLNEVPFDFLMKKKMEGAKVKVLRSEYTNYYYITSHNIHQVYSHNGHGGEKVSLVDFTIHDVFEAIDSNPEFKEKIKSYLGNRISTAAKLD